MNFFIERPKCLYALIAIIPALIFTISRYKIIAKTLFHNNSLQKDFYTFRRARMCFTLRTIFFSLSYIMAVLGFAGVRWGSASIPVQRNGHSVAFVYDISYSMNARDCPNGLSRLEAAASYSNELLNHIPGASVGAVIAKGQGVVAVPVTEDTEYIRSLIGALDPSLMSAEGTSLGSGINAAIECFPRQSAGAACIWLFTDGEETDDSLEPALVSAVNAGIPVAIVGFGSERETEILAGDGYTRVKTALRSQNIEKVVQTVNNKKNHLRKNTDVSGVIYVDASEVGSAYTLCKMLGNTKSGSMESYSFEIKSIERYPLFILLSIIFFIAAIVFGEINIISRSRSVLKNIAGAGLVLCLFSSCSGSLSDNKMILQGQIDWNRKDYQNAVAEFLDVAHDAGLNGKQVVQDYALYGLGTTYLMQDEVDSASMRYMQITEQADAKIKFSVLYNSGIIEHRKGNYQKASEFFKKALELDSHSIDAKINLELSLREKNISSIKKEQTLAPLTEDKKKDDSMENAIYSIIKESEHNQWKNQTSNVNTSSKDY